MAATTILVVALLTLMSQSEALTETRVTSIKALISAHITAKDADNALTTPPTSLLAGAVRLAFTDCIGGCDGCVNVDDERNAGLEHYIDQLDELYDQDYTQIMSRADFWALAAIVALEDAANSCSGPSCGTPEVPSITFKFGRVDCAESPKTTTSQTIPDAHNVDTDMFTVMGDSNDLNLSDDEIVALMGAHTLGRTRKANVGFNGAWVQKRGLLDNAYYVDMIDSSLGWTQSNLYAGKNRPPRWQWDQGNRMMLNTDMNLYKDLDLSANDGSSACTYSSCPDASTKATVEAYAASNTLWIDEFGPAFEKVIENTDETLKDLYTTLTSAEVDIIRADIITNIETNVGTMPNQITIETHVGGFVRLSFHDCVGAACDGCVDLSKADNAGLSDYIDDLEVTYATYSDKLSRADFWALAGIVAVDRGIANCNRASCRTFTTGLTFRTGRVDCVTPITTNAFPDAHDGLTETLAFFTDSDGFAFSQDETVALLGAHTLGRAHGNQASGFENPWVGDWDGLDNAFYKDMLNSTLGWKRVDVQAGTGNDERWQWVHSDDTKLMLNSDMCLAKDLQLTGAVAGCTYDNCADSLTNSKVVEYANDNQLWVDDFASVFQKMIEHGWNDLEDNV